MVLEFQFINMFSNYQAKSFWFIYTIQCLGYKDLGKSFPCKNRKITKYDNVMKEKKYHENMEGKQII